MSEADGAGGARAAVRVELWLAVEILALAALVFSRPVLDGMGQATDVFIARDTSRPGVVLWLLAVLLVPAAAFAGAGFAGRRLAARGPGARWPGARRWVSGLHPILVGTLAGMAAWRLVLEQRDGGRWSAGALIAGAVAAVAVGGLRWWSRSAVHARTFLRWAGVAPAIFLVQFVLFSPVGNWAFHLDRKVDERAAAEAAETLGDDPPPVVVVVMDELPTATLLDGEGHIDGDLFPNFARLAGTSTWYRNHTAVSPWTQNAVPALVTGTYTGPDDDPHGRAANLFTLLGGGAYDLQVKEVITDLCPPRWCERPTTGDVRTLLGDARRAWEAAAGGPFLWYLPELDVTRYEDAEGWIRDLDLDRQGASPFVFQHLMMPHTPWQFTGEGVPYRDPGAVYGTALFKWKDSGTGIDAAQQAHVLQAQAGDRLLGLLLDRLREAGIMDDALVVVTADHGYGFVPGEPLRGVGAGNLHHVLWSPLLVKAPGQDTGRIDDRNVESVDVLPTVADILGLDFPWQIDGRSAAGRPARDPDVKTVVPAGDVSGSVGGQEDVRRYDPDDWFDRVLTERFVEARGPDAAWRRTAHGDLLGQPIDEVGTGDGVDGALAMEEPSAWGPVDAEEPLPLSLRATTGLAPGTAVAFGVNGRVAALSEVEAAGENNVVLGLARPELFREGENDLTAYVVEGAPGRERLRPLTVRF